MLDMIAFIIPTIATAIIFVAYFAYLLPFRFKNRRLLVLPVLAILIPSTLVSGASNSNMVLNFFVNYVLLLVALCFFRKILLGFLYALILEVVFLLYDGFIYYTICIIWGNVALATPLYYFPGQFVMIMLSSITVSIIARKFKSIQQFDIPKSYWLLLLITPFGSIFLMYHTNLAFQVNHTMLFETLVVVLILFAMIVGSTVIYSNIVDYFNIKLSNQALSSQLMAFSQKQQDIARQHSETIKIRHDLKNQLVPIQTALEEREYQRTCDSLRQVIGTFDTQHHITYTGIEYIDDMLNYKASIACEFGIAFHVNDEMDCPPAASLMDISAAIGIALDNVIEACCQDKVSKDVYIEFGHQKGVFYIKIENHFLHDLKMNRYGELLTTKTDTANHGLGINSIRALIEKNGGVIDLKTENGKFILKMIMNPSK